MHWVLHFGIIKASNFHLCCTIYVVALCYQSMDLHFVWNFLLWNIIFIVIKLVATCNESVCRSSCIIHIVNDDNIDLRQYCTCSCPMENMWILFTPSPCPTIIFIHWSHMAQLIHCCPYATSIIGDIVLSIQGESEQS